MNQHIIIAGGSGLVGRALTVALKTAGDSVTWISRNSAHATSQANNYVPCINWDDDLAATFRTADAVVNLAGAGIADQRWSDARKEELHNSRVTATRHIVDAIRSLDNPPSLINASAVGGYGPRGNTPVDESSQTGAGYLAEVCRAWEAEADRAVGSTRVVKVRIGLALSTEGGALAKMFLPFRLGLGGPIGSGSQGMPWIHIDDLTNILQLAIDNTDCTGVINAVAPNPVNNKTFTRTLGRVLHRPAILPAPAIALKLLLGEMAEALLLEGQFVLPTRVLDLGYAFQYPELEPALRDLLSV